MANYNFADQGQVGPVAVVSSLGVGQIANMRLGNMGDLIVQELHGRNYESAYRKAAYNAANQAGQTTTVGLAATYTGLCLSNAPGNSVNLVLNKVGVSFLVAFAAAATVGLMTGFNATTAVTHTTPGVIHSNFYNNLTTGQGLVDTSATMPTAPVVTHVFGTGLTGAITTVPQIMSGLFDLEGSLILPPGAYCAIYTSTASGASSMIASMSWEEVPL